MWNREAEHARVRRRVFCSSMADVFEDHPANNEERPKLWDLVNRTPWLDWLLLTKRPENIRAMVPDDWGSGYANVWLGTSIEDERVIDRSHTLVSTPAAVHFLSIEPLIGRIPNVPLIDIEWVIVGGESGAGCRPMLEDWVLEIQRQCDDAHVPFFFKQWGGVHKAARGRLLQGRLHDNFPARELAHAF